MDSKRYRVVVTDSEGNEVRELAEAYTREQASTWVQERAKLQLVNPIVSVVVTRLYNR